MWWYLVTFPLFLLATSRHEIEYNTRVRHWKREISLSLKSNIHGCDFTYNRIMPVNFSISNYEGKSSENHRGNERERRTKGMQRTNFHVQHFLPSWSDYQNLQQLPLTLTKAHRDVPLTASMRRYNYQEWGSEKILRWEVPMHHPGQNRNNCIRMTENAARDGKLYSVYEEFRHIDRSFYVINARNALIHPSGAVMTKCGYYQGEESCENRWNQAKSWSKQCKLHLQYRNITWNDLFNEKRSSRNEVFLQQCTAESDAGIPFSQSGNPSPVQQVRSVIVISALWDYNYHHFLADSLARLSSIYPFLVEREDIFIQVRSFEEYDRVFQHNKGFQNDAKIMRKYFFDLLGISPSRIISGPILAKEVFIPRSLRCSYALSNPIEIRKLAEILRQRALESIKINFPRVYDVINDYHIFKSQQEYSSMASILTLLPQEFLERTSLSWPPSISTKFIQEQLNKDSDRYMLIYQRYLPHSNDRYWDDDLFASIILSFSQAFPNHIVLPFSSKRLFKSNYCLACDFFMYSLPDVFVAAHGAGLTNMMFFPVNSLVVEIAGEFKDVNMPVCGYYGPFAAIFGHHHYLYSYSFEKQWLLQSQSAADEATSFYNFIQSYSKEAVHTTSKDFIIHIQNSTGGYPYRP